MGHLPERTCIGCRGVFNKADVVRIVSGPSGPVIDYREKLPGRAAYVCPSRECIAKALSRENLSRALHTSVSVPTIEAFIQALSFVVREKIRSLLLMAARAGMLAAGASAVDDALQKGRVEMLIFADDLSEGTKHKLLTGGLPPKKQTTLFTRDELGQMVGRELVGVVGILDKGFSNAVWSESERLKGLLNKHL
jgi:predicted RNA-binding protein YlxR (DUF448 family)/ribosomal protein L7Ae-like RNA K-turn-binding protein